VAPLLAIEFLHRVAEIFEDYFGSLDEMSIKENFSTCYQLLEEMLDHGGRLAGGSLSLSLLPTASAFCCRLPAHDGAERAQSDDPTAHCDESSRGGGRLPLAIAGSRSADSRGAAAQVATGKSGVSEELPDGTISNMPWRKAGVKYAQNEIYMDIIEEVDAIIDRNGQVVSSEVTGLVQANSRLSGIPDLTMTFVDPEVIDGPSATPSALSFDCLSQSYTLHHHAYASDCSFHPCVRYNRFERDRVVSFVPPDGQFELMKYRVSTKGTVAPPIYCQSQVIAAHWDCVLRGPARRHLFSGDV
jgi:AP-3 complex subunit mu